MQTAVTMSRRLDSGCIALKLTRIQTTRGSLEMRLIVGMMSLLIALLVITQRQKTIDAQ